jgi:hypothetical protein
MQQIYRGGLERTCHLSNRVILSHLEGFGEPHNMLL